MPRQYFHYCRDESDGNGDLAVMAIELDKMQWYENSCASETCKSTGMS
jgi:hypothetical protein